MASAHIWTLGILFTLSEWYSPFCFPLVLPAYILFQNLHWWSCYLQVDWELSRWLSQKMRSLSRKGIQHRWSAPHSVSGSPYLSWYVQHRNQGLQFLQIHHRGPLVKGNYGFEAEFYQEPNLFPPEETICSREWLCCVLLCCEPHSGGGCRESWI